MKLLPASVPLRVLLGVVASPVVAALLVLVATAVVVLIRLLPPLSWWHWLAGLLIWSWVLTRRLRADATPAVEGTERSSQLLAGRGNSWL